MFSFNSPPLSFPGTLHGPLTFPSQYLLFCFLSFVCVGTFVLVRGMSVKPGVCGGLSSSFAFHLIAFETAALPELEVHCFGLASQ